MIRVLLVDDSPVALHILQQLLSLSSDIQVVGTAANGQEALDLLPGLNPDVICTDLHMPVLDGLAFIRVVMAEHPRPILVVSVSVEPDSPNVFQLLEAGAVDVYPKPRAISDTNKDKLAREFISKIRVLSGVHVFRHTSRASVVPAFHLPYLQPRGAGAVQIVVIGASTGGPQAFHAIISGLTPEFPVPVICIQHIGSGFLSEMVTWLNEVSPLPVRKAVHGERPQAGVVYFAPEDAHLEFDQDGNFALTHTSLFDGHRPSVTITMRAVARKFGANAVGVLLSGMGRDGADGMAEINASGGITIAQNEASCVIYGMPKIAVELGVAQHVLHLDHIATALLELVKNRNGISGKS